MRVMLMTIRKHLALSDRGHVFEFQSSMRRRRVGRARDAFESTLTSTATGPRASSPTTRDVFVRRNNERDASEGQELHAARAHPGAAIAGGGADGGPLRAAEGESRLDEGPGRDARSTVSVFRGVT